MEKRKRKNYIFEINDNDFNINKDIDNKNKNKRNNNKYISFTKNNIEDNQNIINNLNNKLTENKEKIKQNQKELSHLINVIKNRELNSKKNKMIRHNTTNEKNFVKNGLNQIYTKTLVINNAYNKNKKNIRTFSSNIFNSNTKSSQASESMNNMKSKISPNDRYTYANIKPIIYNNKNKSMKKFDLTPRKNVYIPKKASLSQKYIYEYKNKEESPVYHKKNMKNNNLRMTYSKKYYSKSNPNFFKQKETNNQENRLDLNNLKKFFERDIDDLSSIHNNSSFEIYTFDNDENRSNQNNNNNYINRNSVYIKKINTYKINFDSNNNNNTINQKKFSETTIKNKKNSDKLDLFINNQKFQFIYNKRTLDDNIHPIKQNLRYSNSEVKFKNFYINSKEQNNDIKNNIDKFLYNKGKPLSLNYNVENNNNIIPNNNIIETKKNLFHKNYKNEIMSSHVDELIIFEERLKNIIFALNNNKKAIFYCYDFLTYFKSNCDIFKNLYLLIKNEYDLKIIQNGINYILISIIFTFDYSYKQGILNNIILYIKEMLSLTYQNLILIYNYFFKKTLISGIKSIWTNKLRTIIINELDKSEKDNNIDYILSTESNKENKNSIETINNNTNFIIQSIKIIIKNYKNKNSNSFLLFLKEIYHKASFTDIFYFFQNKILYSNELFSYLSPTLIQRQNPNLFKDIIPSYIKSFARKKYSLVLGLENNLINYKYNSNYNFNRSGVSGIIELRPGLIHFLSEMKKYFELIIFTLYSQKVGDYIINYIEQKEKYFDFRFYVQHSVIIDNEFTKDLKRIGRALDKIIIVDNNSQNFKLNKKNAINIKSFWGLNNQDSTLFELEKILIKILKEGDDIRNGIEKYRNDVIGKVTSNTYINI